MTNKIRNNKNSIKLSKNYLFEFDEFLIKNFNMNENFLGWEYSFGNIRSIVIQKYFQNSNIIFYPITKTSLQESAIVKNLEIGTDYFSHFKNAHVLIDFPEEVTPILNSVIKSFPHCVTLSTKEHLENKNPSNSHETLLNKLIDDPIIFIEPLDTRRYLLKLLQENCLSVHCIGGIENILQWKLHNNHYNLAETPQTELMISGALTTWIQNNLETDESNLIKQNANIKSEFELASKNIIQFIQKHQNEKIIIICGYELLKFLGKKLGKIKNKSEFETIFNNNISSFVYAKVKHNHKQFVISQPSYETFSEYISLTGFFARDLIKEDQFILNWIDFAKKSYSAAFIRTCEKYADWTKLKINASQERDYFRFSYRLALDRNMLFPSIFDILLAATSVIDSNFAYELLKECKDIPKNLLFENTLPQLDLPLNIFFNQTSKISIQKFETIQSNKKFSKAKIKSVDKLNQNKSTDPVSEDKYADNNWVHEDHPYSCSFPSEDIFMERLALNIKRNMSDKLKSQEITFQELQTDFCEGIDIRETIRNWHKEKIIIKDLHNTGKPDIGTVVFSFVDTSQDNNYSWKSFWLAEQHDDSNLMFYATPFKDNLIGPGIAKSEFGGFAVIPLPSAIENPWGNPFIQHYAKNATEYLILAGALSTNHKSILFISNHPPSQHISKILKQSRKNIIYAKLDEFPQEDIRMVRTFHILAEAGVRSYAQKYIRKDS
ncbi:MAG: hypothetical protein K2X69_01070 [Silvanigrellaceae bacterium]|nr:hypothetical protein [Silvanigrellaceae bacterium]